MGCHHPAIDEAIPNLSGIVHGFVRTFPRALLAAERRSEDEFPNLTAPALTRADPSRRTFSL
jgi:hypothetical protein